MNISRRGKLLFNLVPSSARSKTYYEVGPVEGAKPKLGPDASKTP
jgi:hypothetical protein